MLPEEKARVKIDKQLRNVGWCIVSRNLNFDTYNSLTPNWYYKVLR